jgi:signal transduction histidine kinase
MMRKSIRYRMMLLFCLVVGVLLAASYVGLYIIFERAVRYEGDRRLLATATPIIADLILDPSGNDVNELNIPDEYFELLDQDGRVLQQSENLLSAGLPIDMGPLNSTESVFSNVADRDRGSLRIAIVPFQLGAEARFLAVAAPPRDAEQALKTFRTLILVLFPISLVLTAGVSAWYTSRSLRPITELTEHVARTIETLPQQNSPDANLLPMASAQDEVGLLAVTFNELFTRLTAVLGQLRQFVSDASHELRTPLAVLQGETELVLSRTRPAEEYEKVLRIIDTELKKLSRIVDGLFTLSMADAGHLRIAREPLYIEEVLEETCGLAIPMVQSKRIRIQQEFERDVTFLGDPAFLRQLFLIFIDNAIKYSPPDSCLRIRLTTDDRNIRIEFQDQGIGIAPEHIPRIFERFYRVSQPNPPNPADTQSGGLGLSIAQAIVQAHDGRIECESHLGTGTVFTIRLPLPAGIQINKN